MDVSGRQLMTSGSDERPSIVFTGDITGLNLSAHARIEVILALCAGDIKKGTASVPSFLPIAA
jgi:hypothetical protein